MHLLAVLLELLEPQRPMVETEETPLDSETAVVAEAPQTQHPTLVATAAMGHSQAAEAEQAVQQELHQQSAVELAALEHLVGVWSLRGNMDYAIVNSSNIVENVCVWDGIEPWVPCHEDDTVVCIDGLSVGIGDTLNEDGTFSKPQPVVQVEEVTE